jgi:Uma2 family endonuclease
MKGLKVLSNMPEDDYFSMILGYEEYKTAIENTSGDRDKLKDVFLNVLRDDYCWEFVDGEIVLRGGANINASIANGNLMVALIEYVRLNKLGKVFGVRCVCDFGENFFSPNIIYFDKEKSKVFEGNTNRFPIPNLIVECNDESCEEQNRGIKFEEYAKHGVEEYWMLNPNNESIEQYQLEKGKFDFVGLIKKEDIIESIVLKGFKICLKDIFNRD